MPLPPHTDESLRDLVQTLETLRDDFARQAWPASSLIDLADELAEEVRRILSEADRPTLPDETDVL